MPAKKGDKSKTRPTKKDYETHKGDQYHHIGGHLYIKAPYNKMVPVRDTKK